MILLDPQAHPVIGHRGNRAHAPENTLPSFLEAVALGADALEMDLHLSRDGVLVVVHDDTLDRTTNGSGPVASRTVAELRGIDAGARFTYDRGATFPWRDRGVTVPTFDDVVEALPRALPLIIEIKTATATPFVLEAIRRHDLSRRVIVAGFDAAAIEPLRGQGFATGATNTDASRLLLPAIRGRSIGPQPYQALCIPPAWRGIPIPLLSFARTARTAGVVTHVWTINDPSEALRLWRGGVHGIISDDPGLMLAARKGL